MKCTKCDIDNRHDAKYCIRCGEKLQTECPACNRVLPFNSKYCDSCGTNYDEATKDKGNEEDYKNTIHQLVKSELSLKDATHQFEKLYIENKLKAFNWNISRTADVIGIERSNLHRKIKALNIQTSGDD